MSGRSPKGLTGRLKSLQQLHEVSLRTLENPSSQQSPRGDFVFSLMRSSFARPSRASDQQAQLGLIAHQVPQDEHLQRFVVLRVTVALPLLAIYSGRHRYKPLED